ncbi:hypothetical protein PGTUg99_029881 [Puccinia graminis f. sp. tritici]|uniref:Uncharacterized protein n=1 Tax=Puccinia graminis f. sp. tritici TaxID=56615 RepID=A0A5B0SL77_PUCGR|nr:hypothetical protein PGTUg99_029881 [Puccinia graminis f. sp. tritici]
MDFPLDLQIFSPNKLACQCAVSESAYEVLDRSDISAECIIVDSWYEDIDQHAPPWHVNRSECGTAPVPVPGRTLNCQREVALRHCRLGYLPVDEGEVRTEWAHSLRRTNNAISHTELPMFTHHHKRVNVDDNLLMDAPPVGRGSGRTDHGRSGVDSA